MEALQVNSNQTVYNPEYVPVRAFRGVEEAQGGF